MIPRSLLRGAFIELHSYIVNREHLSNTPGAWSATPRETAETFAPIEENIRRVKTAYEILAYPHCKSADRREEIEAELETDRQEVGRDQVELDDAELKILGRLAAARNLPFHPEKRVYHYDDVFHPAQPIENALNGAEFITWLHEQARAGTQGGGK